MVRIRTAPRPHPGVAAVALLRLRDAALVLLVAAGACHAPDDGERPGPAGPSEGGEATAPDPGAAEPGGAEPDATPEAGGETPDRPAQGGFVSEPAEGYDGPPVTAVLEVMESFPEQYAVAVEVTAPTGGHELEHTATRKAADGATEVELKLTTPGEGEGVTQALETLRVRVPLESRPQEVRIRVAQWMRGAHYVREPDAVLAAVIARR